MKPKIKFRLLLSFLLVCLLGVLAQSYFLWDLNETLEVSQGENSSIPDSLEGRLEVISDQADAPIDSLNTTRLIGQNYRKDPLERMRRIQRARQQTDPLRNFSSESGAAVSNESSFSSESLQLSINETETEYQVLIQIPSDHELEISTDLEANLLTISGTLTRNLSNNTNSTASNFTSRSQFTRSFELTKPVNELGLYTEIQEGGLVIGIPKR